MKNLTWIILFLCLAIAGDRLAGWAMDQVAMESRFRYSRLYNGTGECDILMIGNSRGLIFYQPYIEEKTGLSTCNLSYNGMPVDLASVLVRDHLDRYPKTRTLLLDVSMLDSRMDRRLLAGFNFYTPYSPRLATLLKGSFPETYYGGFVSHLFRYNSEVFQRALYYWKKSDKDWLLDRVISASMQRDAANLDPFAYDYTPDMLSDLASLVQVARERGVQVELLMNPYYPPFAEKIENLEPLLQDVRAATGLDVRNYANSIQVTEGFGDYQHLNKTGARAYIDRLIHDQVLPAR